MRPLSLEDLERDIARDLDLIHYPGGAWMPGRSAGEDVLDVLIVGAGQGGLAIGAKLIREQVRNILIIDKSERGEEGIWMRYARMKTLRTPKSIGGPDLGIPSLTFQAWYEAQFGEQAFAAIKYIPKEEWQRYLSWFRETLGLPVMNKCELVRISQDPEGLAVVVHDSMGERIVRTRKLVLAAGIETSGRWWMPPEIAALPARLRAHTADAIDFEALRGRKVIVIGAAASAFDNAATALEHGASVQMLCRRDSIQRVQPYKVLAFSGFLGHMGRMPDRDRWRIMNYLLTVREALTAETWARATRHADFDLVTDAPILSAKESNGRAYIETKSGNFEADFVIAGTGFDVDLHSRPELDGVADLIATWSDRYAPPPSEANPRLGRYPYLDDGMAFTEKTLGEAPWIRNIYCFNFGATASFGPSGSSISALKYAAPRLVAALTESLFREDLRIHEDMIRGYSTPEFDLRFAGTYKTHDLEIAERELMDLSVVWNYLPFLLAAAGSTLWISFLSLVFGSMLGLLIAAARVSKSRVASSGAWIYVWLVRGTPMLLQIFTIYYWLPSLGIVLPAFVAGVLALSINSAGYFVDIFRSGYLSVPSGQVEAGYGVGLTPWQVMARIVLPLAARPALPPYIGQAINLVKNSSLVSVISVQELMFTSQSIYSSTYKIAEILGTAGLLYLAINTMLQLVQLYIERRFDGAAARR